MRPLAQFLSRGAISVRLPAALLFGIFAAVSIEAEDEAPVSPADLHRFMPQSWNLETMEHQLWVSPQGVGDGSSRLKALGSIQTAIEQARPGTVIFVTAGTYPESLALARSAEIASGTDESPIFLVSVDGCEAAEIKPGRDVTNLDANRIQNWAVVGFHFVGAGSTTDGDNSPIKIGASNLIEGEPARNWWVAGNTFSGTGHDGSKAYHARNITWLGNHYDGEWGQEACDNVAVGVSDATADQNHFVFNTVAGTSGYSAITVKYGSNHFLIAQNEFTINTGTRLPLRGAMIRVGGNGDLKRFVDRLPHETDPAFSVLTASHVRVMRNRFSGVCGINVELYGSRNSEIGDNDLVNPNAPIEIQATEARLGDDPQGNPYRWTARNNRIVGNRISAPEENSFGGRLEGEAFSVADNRSDRVFEYPTGAAAVRPAIDALIDTLLQTTSAAASLR